LSNRRERILAAGFEPFDGDVVRIVSRAVRAQRR
jgi:hypothetical protein